MTQIARLEFPGGDDERRRRSRPRSPLRTPSAMYFLLCVCFLAAPVSGFAPRSQHVQQSAVVPSIEITGKMQLGYMPRGTGSENSRYNNQESNRNYRNNSNAPSGRVNRRNRGQPPPKPFIIERIGDAPTENIFRQISDMCIDVFFKEQLNARPEDRIP